MFKWHSSFGRLGERSLWTFPLYILVVFSSFSLGSFWFLPIYFQTRVLGLHWVDAIGCFGSLYPTLEWVTLYPRQFSPSDWPPHYNGCRPHMSGSIKHSSIFQLLSRVVVACILVPLWQGHFAISECIWTNYEVHLWAGFVFVWLGLFIGFDYNQKLIWDSV